MIRNYFWRIINNTTDKNRVYLPNAWHCLSSPELAAQGLAFPSLKARNFVGKFTLSDRARLKSPRGRAETFLERYREPSSFVGPGMGAMYIGQK